LTTDGGKYYLPGVIDDYSRLAWVEVLRDKKAMTVMFATLKSFNMLKRRYGVEIDAVRSFREEQREPSVRGFARRNEDETSIYEAVQA
jgi:hypothetical protein